MSEKSLEEILHQLHDERVASEQVLASVHALASGELKAVFEQAITLAKLESQLTSPQISEQLIEVVSSSTSKMELVSDELRSTTELLEKRTEDLKRFQRRCTMLGGICFALAFCCSAFIGWTGYSYWVIKATTSSFWFQKIIVENAEVIDKCLDPEVLRHSNGKCTIQLPVITSH